MSNTLKVSRLVSMYRRVVLASHVVKSSNLCLPEVNIPYRKSDYNRRTWSYRVKEGAGEAVDCPRVVSECAKRTMSPTASKKKPVDADVVKSIIDRFGAEGASLKELRIAAVTSLGFAGFFRFNELSSIQPNHIFFHEEFVKAFEPMSKTEVYREGTMCICLS